MVVAVVAVVAVVVVVVIVVVVLVAVVAVVAVVEVASLLLLLCKLDVERHDGRAEGLGFRALDVETAWVLFSLRGWFGPQAPRPGLEPRQCCLLMPGRGGCRGGRRLLDHSRNSVTLIEPKTSISTTSSRSPGQTITLPLSLSLALCPSVSLYICTYTYALYSTH